MLISISFAYAVCFILFCLLVFCFLSDPSLFTLLCFSFFLFGRVSLHWSSYHTFISTTLSAGGGESGLLGNQAALDPKVSSSQPL